MKKTVIIISAILIVIAVIVALSVHFKKSEHIKSVSDTTSVADPQTKQLNIVVLLDLSDRINPQKAPYQKDRDIAVVSKLTKIFKDDMKKRGAFAAKGKMRVVFFPVPNDPNMANIAAKLKVDLSNADVKQKKEVYDNITNNFKKNLSTIYSQSIRDSNWRGSDIWRFFMEDIDNYIVPGYRNVLVVLTDGYIYDVASKTVNGQESQYITHKLLQSKGITSVDKIKDFRLANKRKTPLSNIEVLFLECNMYNFPNDWDIVKTILNSWCKKMGILKTGFYKTDFPVNAEQNIENFMNLQ